MGILECMCADKDEMAYAKKIAKAVEAIQKKEKKSMEQTRFALEMLVGAASLGCD